MCLMLLGFGICMGIGIFFRYRDGEQEYDTLREYVALEEPKENADGEKPKGNQEETVTKDFETLKKCFRVCTKNLFFKTDRLFACIFWVLILQPYRSAPFKKNMLSIIIRHKCPYNSNTILQADRFNRHYPSGILSYYKLRE